MKRIWKARKENEGVSPVIATILMVAITVVLAAVLYVMVMGIRPPDTDVNAGSWNEVKALSGSTARAEFGQFAGAMGPQNLRLYIKVNGTDAGYVKWSSNTDPSLISWVDGPAGASVTYFDYEPMGGEVNAGDYVMFSGLQPGTMYTIKAFNTASSQVISMTGASPTFTTP